MEKVLSTKHVSAELSILCKDGSVKPHFLTGNLIEFENKQCVIGMGIDITERIKTETKLQQTESLRKAVGTTIQVLVSAVEARIPTRPVTSPGLRIWPVQSLRDGVSPG